MRNVREQVPESPKQYQLAVNDLFGDLVMRLLEKRPEDRYETPSALLKDLERIGNYNSLTI